jgi:hypothetical protein
MDRRIVTGSIASVNINITTNPSTAVDAILLLFKNHCAFPSLVVESLRPE